MVKLALCLKATLSGVTNLHPQLSTDAAQSSSSGGGKGGASSSSASGQGQEYYFSLTVTCSSCRERHPNPVQVSRHEQIEMPGSRGTANFVWKCRNCGRDASANIEETSAHTHPSSSPSNSTGAAAGSGATTTTKKGGEKGNTGAGKKSSSSSSSSSTTASTSLCVPYTASMSGTPVKILWFETRNCEFTEFHATGPWTCESFISTHDEDGNERSAGRQAASGAKRTVFRDVEVVEGEWYEYDEGAGSEVSITDIEWSIVRA